MIHDINQIVDSYNYSVSELVGKCPRARILVNSEGLKNEESVNLTEYFDVIISASVGAYCELGASDLVFWKHESAYDNGIFVFDSLLKAQYAIVVVNSICSRQLKKINKKLGLPILTYDSVTPENFDGNWLSLAPGLVKGVEELHLAFTLLGADFIDFSNAEIFSDRKAPGVRHIDTKALMDYVNEKEVVSKGPASITYSKNKLKGPRLSLRHRF